MQIWSEHRMVQSYIKQGKKIGFLEILKDQFYRSKNKILDGRNFFKNFISVVVKLWVNRKNALKNSEKYKTCENVSSPTTHHKILQNEFNLKNWDAIYTKTWLHEINCMSSRPGVRKYKFYLSLRGTLNSGVPPSDLLCKMVQWKRCH